MLESDALNVFEITILADALLVEIGVGLEGADLLGVVGGLLLKEL